MKSISAVFAHAVLAAALAAAARPANAAAAVDPVRSVSVASAAATPDAPASETSNAPAAQSAASDGQDDQPCHWWQFRRCRKEVRADTLPPDAPKEGAVITVDVSTHTAYLFKNGELVERSPAATGSGKLLKRGSRVWLFHTPRGRLLVQRKIVDPVWTKPDWAFIEEGDRVPPADSPKRKVRGHLGKYALDLGEGILIHGTDDPSSIGKPVSHGCIRLPDEMLEEVYNAARVGTPVYIFESKVSQQAAGGGVERHSDLDFR